jgi:L-lactate dehydrogenase (cytochrome)
MAGGRAGVDRTIQILTDQLVRTMKLLEVSTLEELTPAHVTQLTRLVPLGRQEATARALAEA